MKPTIKVINHLCDLGFKCHEEEIKPTRGYWSHNHQDVIERWRLFASWDGRNVLIVGLDSVTKCARHGFWVVPGDKKDNDGDFEVMTLKQQPSMPANAVIRQEDSIWYCAWCDRKLTDRDESYPDMELCFCSEKCANERRANL